MTATETYTILTGFDAMQPERVHDWISKHSYWAKDIPFETLHTTMKHSFCVGVFHNGLQVGFARFVTDYAVFAYMADVYVEETHRGQGLGKRMMDTLMGQPWIKGLRRMTLGTKDAHGLYAQYGFRPIAHPERLMEIVQHAADVYQQPKQDQQ
jgi:GNAT superfamily N-acetyltransferase